MICNPVMLWCSIALKCRFITSFWAPRKHAYVCDNIVYDTRKAEDVVIEREVDAHPDDDVFVLDPAHHAGIVSNMTKEARWAEIHAEYEQESQAENTDDEIN